MIALNLLVLRVEDLDRAERFYRRLGITFTRERHGRGPEHLAATIGELVLELYPLRDTPTTGLRIGFVVPSIDDCLSSHEPGNGAIAMAANSSEWGRRAVVVDPDGHHIELLERNATDTP
jgi:lactoylglutathione lyase